MLLPAVHFVHAASRLLILTPTGAEPGEDEVVHAVFLPLHSSVDPQVHLLPYLAVLKMVDHPRADPTFDITHFSPALRQSFMCWKRAPISEIFRCDFEFACSLVGLSPGDTGSLRFA